MEVIRAKTAGFCFGVKRAVETVYEEVQKQGNIPIYTYGPIIHNDEVVKDLAAKGVRVIKDEAELETIKEGVVIIRSHGVSKRISDKIEEQGLIRVDATCPFVKKIHNIVEKESKAGKHIVIIGNDAHPEVEGIKGWSESEVTVIQSAEDAQDFSLEEEKEICIVSQTTFNYNKFKDLVEIIQKKRY